MNTRQLHQEAAKLDEHYTAAAALRWAADRIDQLTRERGVVGVTDDLVAVCPGDVVYHPSGRVFRVIALDEAIDKVMDEIADTVIYADLLSARMGRGLAEAIVRKFNAISEREGFPERLMPDSPPITETTQ